MSNSSLISNMSYTSRDFNSIYPELLDLVKKITYKWDPSISNESDPGVILLKLNALIADKCNYNIDKNVLECFPLSVTQEANARQLYEQLGYFMHWYRSATTKVSLFWKDFENYTPSDEAYVELPRFTMVSDYNNDIVYTLLSTESSELNAVSTTRIYVNGEATTVNAIQGTATVYKINDRDVIQASDLDSNNRLYFKDRNIAENGIFICNDSPTNSYNYADWIRKDNLSAENLGNTYYSFGVLPISNICYVEFPDDAETIFKNGIRLVYIQTRGKEGDIPYKSIERFYNDLPSVLRYANGDEATININTDIIELSNIVSGEGGRDKETLNEAYKNYRHTIGTFNTLITLRDYINAIINGPQLASNVIVADRTNDIQCSYKVMSSVNDFSTLINKVDRHKDLSTLTAYDIKLYALNYSSATIDTDYEYDTSFQLLNNKEQSAIKLYVNDLKAIPHEFMDIRTPEQDPNNYVPLDGEPYDWDYGTYYTKDGDDYVIVPEGTEWDPATTYYERKDYFRSHYCLFKNLYPISCRITPIRTLDEIEQEEVIESIKKAIYENLNSQQIEFGESITPQALEKIITNSDERISSTAILNIDLKTYATYWNGKEFRDVLLSNTSETEPYLYSYNNPLFENITASSSFRSSTNSSDLSWGLYIFKYIEGYDHGSWSLSSITNGEESSAVLVNDMSSYVNDPDNILSRATNGNWFMIEINPVDRIKDEIYIKSVLQGVTALYVNDNEFDYDINQVQKLDIVGNLNNSIVENVKSITTSTEFDISNVSNYYKLRNDENIRFCTTNLIEGSKFSNYVKYLLISSSSISADKNYELTSSDYLFLFWKETDESADPYKYEVYSEGFVVTPSFSMSAYSSTVPSDLQDLASHVTNVGTSQSVRKMTNSDMYREISSTENDYAVTVVNWLSQNKTIQIKHRNTVSLHSNYNCYWVLDNKNDNRYVLFDDYTNIQQYQPSSTYNIGNKVYIEVGDSLTGYNEYYQCIEDTSAGDFDPTKWMKLPSYSYTLGIGEYFYYESLNGSGLNILGAGTRIERPTNFTEEWSVPVINQSKITSVGLSALEGKWFAWPENGASLVITEQQYVNLGSDAYVLFVFSESGSYNINSYADTELDKIQTIKYTFNDITGHETDPSYYENTLPNMGNIDNWRAKAILALAVGEDEEQVLYSGQHVDLTLMDDSTVIRIDGEDPPISGNIEYPVVIQSKMKLDVISATGKTYTYTYDEDRNKVFNKIYVYSKSRNQSNCIYRSSGGAIVTFENRLTLDDPEEIDIEFSVPATDDTMGEGYILSIYNPNDDMSTASVTATLSWSGGTKILYPIGTKTDYNLSNNGMYYFNIDINPDVYTLTLTLDHFITPDMKSIVINKLYRYVKPENITVDNFYNYMDLLMEFDVDNEFQYTYQVPKNILIEDPLDPQSFLNPHHIYNSYTLCKYDTNFKNSTVKISSR